MKNIEATIVADSLNPAGNRITSFLCTYPRFIHSEIMTHRMLSRNAASSRAIPVKKVIEAVRDNPAMPEWWGKTQKGMQAAEQLDDLLAGLAEQDWLNLREDAIATAELMQNKGLHKQIANRVLEPWFHITVLITSTSWQNFFKLRAHPAAQPEFQVLAYRMLDAYLRGDKQQRLDWGMWHLPFDPGEPWTLEQRIHHSVAAAARTSYTNMDKEASTKEDRELHDRLAAMGHWSPFEHQAEADVNATRSGNFVGGWRQYRQDHLNHDFDAHHVDLDEVMAAKPDWVKL